MGHIHIGYPDPDPETSIELVKFLDLFVGVPSVILDPDAQRRKLYGKAGAMRLKEYGLEYRVPSNYWIQDKDLVLNTFHLIKLAMEAFNRDMAIGKYAKDIVDCINDSNVDLAGHICEHLGIPILELA